MRIKLRVPELGFGWRMDAMHRWLDREIGRGDYAMGPAETMPAPNDAMAVYFRTVEDACRFVKAFEPELADGTTCQTYSSPTFPFGRHDKS